MVCIYLDMAFSRSSKLDEIPDTHLAVCNVFLYQYHGKLEGVGGKDDG